MGDVGMQVLTLRWDTLSHHSSEGLRSPSSSRTVGVAPSREGKRCEVPGHPALVQV